jgi:hypothetical protein
MLCLAHVRKTKPRNTLDQRTLEFFIAHRLKLARSADFRALDAMTSENG